MLCKERKFVDAWFQRNGELNEAQNARDELQAPLGGLVGRSCHSSGVCDQCRVLLPQAGCPSGCPCIKVPCWEGGCTDFTKRTQKSLRVQLEANLQCCCHAQDAASSSESEGLLDSDHHQLQEAEHDDLHQQRNQQLTDAAIKEEQAGSGRASLQAPHSTSTLLRRSVRDGKSQESGQKALVSVAEAKAVAGPGKSVQGPAQASPTKSAPAKGPAAEQASSVHLPDPHSPPVLPESEKPAGKRAKVLQEPGPSPAAAEQVDVGFLQGLIDTELGPPKFAMAKPKPPPSPARHMPGDSVGSGSLQELLNQEFGAPRFAVPKTNATASPAKPAAAAEAAVLSPSAATRAPTSADRPHLRLEVLSGPATGHVFDTMDVAAEVGDAAHQFVASMSA